MIAPAALLAAQAAASPAPVTVPVLRVHLREWMGRRVAVRGWTHGCGAPLPNLSGRCYLTPSARWRGERGRLKLLTFPRRPGGPDEDPVVQVVVRGTVEEDRCPADAICLDGESDLRVDAVEPIGERRP